MFEDLWKIYTALTSIEVKGYSNVVTLSNVLNYLKQLMDNEKSKSEGSEIQNELTEDNEE